MLTRFRGFAARLAATAAVGGLAISAGATLDGGLVIVAPVQVQAGNPICGYVTGTTPETVVQGIGPNGPLPAPPPPLGSPPPDEIVPLVQDPYFYAFATIESMAVCVVQIHAYDSMHTASASTLVY